MPDAERAPELDFPVAALRAELVLPELRFVLAERPLRAEGPERPDDALRELDALDAAADLRDFVLFVLFLVLLRAELLLRDFPRDFLALVAITLLLGVVDGKTTPTIARIRHIRKTGIRAKASAGFAFREKARAAIVFITVSRCHRPLRAIQSSLSPREWL